MLERVLLLGLAVKLYNYVYMDFSNDLKISSLDGLNVVNRKSNLIYKSAIYLFKFCGFKKFESLKIIQIRKKGNVCNFILKKAEV